MTFPKWLPQKFRVSEGEKRSKYGAKKAEGRDGRSYHSQAERTVAAFLQLQERAGEIRNLEYQAEVRLTDAGIIYKPDFKFERKIHERGSDRPNAGEVWKLRYGECKGMITPEWRIKRKLYAFYGPAPLEVYGVDRSGRVVFIEEIGL